MAIEWGGQIKEKAEAKCYAPVDSSDLTDIARCQSLKYDTIKKDQQKAIKMLKIKFQQESQLAVDNKFGIIKFWNDAILEETIESL